MKLLQIKYYSASYSRTITARQRVFYSIRVTETRQQSSIFSTRGDSVVGNSTTETHSVETLQATEILVLRQCFRRQNFRKQSNGNEALEVYKICAL